MQYTEAPAIYVYVTPTLVEYMRIVKLLMKIKIIMANTPT